MANTPNLNLDPKTEGSTSWFDSWSDLHDVLDDLGKLLVKSIPVRFDPEASQVFYDAWVPDENITIFAVGIDASAGAPSGGPLQGKVRVDGTADDSVFELASGATFSKTTLTTAIDVDAGERVGAQWTSVPSTPGLIGIVDLYYQVRAIS